MREAALRVCAACLGAFVFGLVLGKIVIPMLRALKAGQSIREIGPKWHAGKAGTPTMGGIIFILAALACIPAGWPLLRDGEYSMLYLFGFSLVFGLIGFLDDFFKVKFKRNLGLTAIEKFLLQLAAAVVYLFLLRRGGTLTNELYLPFVNVTLTIPWVLYFVFAAFVMVGCVNAVNLTDGIDGLATGVTMPVMLFFVILALRWGHTGTALFSAALLGGLGAFLCYNFHPARVFMGDTGSLFLGAAVCGLAFALDAPLVLLLVGIIYIVETVSVILQVTYFKLTHGKRIFKMTPIHHHFELCGWKEEKIVFIFTAVTLVMCVLAYLGVRYRY